MTWKFPEGIQQRLYQIKTLCNDDEVVTYPQFLAFNKLLDHLFTVDKIIQSACLKKGGAITQEEFKAAASILPDLSPLETEILFTIFDTDRDGKMDLNNFRCVVTFGHNCSAAELANLVVR